MTLFPVGRKDVEIYSVVASLAAQVVFDSVADVFSVQACCVCLLHRSLSIVHVTCVDRLAL